MRLSWKIGACLSSSLRVDGNSLLSFSENLRIQVIKAARRGTPRLPSGAATRRPRLYPYMQNFSLGIPVLLPGGFSCGVSCNTSCHLGPEGARPSRGWARPRSFGRGPRARGVGSRRRGRGAVAGRPRRVGGGPARSEATEAVSVPGWAGGRQRRREQRCLEGRRTRHPERRPQGRGGPFPPHTPRTSQGLTDQARNSRAAVFPAQTQLWRVH